MIQSEKQKKNEENDQAIRYINIHLMRIKKERKKWYTNIWRNNGQQFLNLMKDMC